jgi:magnesium chelatase family protein
MVTRVSTVAFEGIEAREVDVQVQIAPGNVVFMIVGLPDKAVAESRERVRSALIASGLALPAKRITVNLAPADLPKEGSHLPSMRPSYQIDTSNLIDVCPPVSSDQVSYR